MLWHIVLMVLPNIFQPKKLWRNIRHPVYEVFHTRHEQYEFTCLDDITVVYVVKHYFFGRWVTVDWITREEFAYGFFGRLKQLFRSDFYYGHCEFFPQPFKLIERKYIR